MRKYLFHQLKSYQLSAIDYQPFHYLQNRAARIIFNKNNINQIKTTLLRSLTALNVYQIKLYEHLNFMYKFKNKQKSKIFNDTINQRYSMIFLRNPFTNIQLSFPKGTLV